MTALSAAEAAARAAELPAEPTSSGARPFAMADGAGMNRRWLWACAALAGVAAVLWLVHVQLAHARWGLFRWIGVDWGVYYAQARALLTYTTDPSIPMLGGHAAYLPLFAWLFVPFAVVPPPATRPC